MGLGILDPPGHPDSDPILRVPGTHVFWNTDVTTKDTHHIVLIPTPTSDPNDPLNWPQWKKEVVLSILCLASIIAATLSTILATNTLTLVFLLDVSFTQIASLTGYFLLGVGCSAWMVSASARVYGKRHTYVFGSLLLVAGSIWGAVAKDYNSLLGARIMQGFGTGPFEMLVPSSIGDMYFVHQRGKRIAIQAMSMFGVSFLTPILTGVITDRMSWRWTFGFVSIFAGILVPFIVLFVPEHAFNREAAFEQERASHTNNPDSETKLKPSEKQPQQTSSSGERTSSQAEREAETEERRRNRASASDESILRQHRESKQFERDEWYATHQSQGWGPFLPQLRLFTGRKSNENPFKILLRPFPLMLHPAVLWGSLTQGTLIVFLVAIATVIAEIFGGPPHFFSNSKVGYFYTGPFIGGIIGFIAAGLMSDWICQVMTKINHGTFEPEFRIVLVIFQLMGATIGLFPFGVSVQDNWSYYVSIVLFAFVTFALIMGATATGTYIVDAHNEMAVEAFVCITLFKNFVSFGMTLHIFDILLDTGDVKMFYILGGVQVGVCLLSIPMYVFGKYSRSYFSKHDILRILKLK